MAAKRRTPKRMTGFVGVRVPRTAGLKADGTLKKGCHWEKVGAKKRGRVVCEKAIPPRGVFCQPYTDGSVQCWANDKYRGGTSKGHGFVKPTKKRTRKRR